MRCSCCQGSERFSYCNGALQVPCLFPLSKHLFPRIELIDASLPPTGPRFICPVFSPRSPPKTFSPFSDPEWSASMSFPECLFGQTVYAGARQNPLLVVERSRAGLRHLNLPRHFRTLQQFLRLPCLFLLSARLCRHVFYDPP